MDSFKAFEVLIENSEDKEKLENYFKEIVERKAKIEELKRKKDDRVMEIKFLTMHLYKLKGIKSEAEFRAQYNADLYKQIKKIFEGSCKISSLLEKVEWQKIHDYNELPNLKIKETLEKLEFKAKEVVEEMENRDCVIQLRQIQKKFGELKEMLENLKKANSQQELDLSKKFETIIQERNNEIVTFVTNFMELKELTLQLENKNKAQYNLKSSSQIKKVTSIGKSNENMNEAKISGIENVKANKKKKVVLDKHKSVSLNKEQLPIEHTSYDTDLINVLKFDCETFLQTQLQKTDDLPISNLTASKITVPEVNDKSLNINSETIIKDSVKESSLTMDVDFNQDEPILIAENQVDAKNSDPKLASDNFEQHKNVVNDDKLQAEEKNPTANIATTLKTMDSPKNEENDKPISNVTFDDDFFLNSNDENKKNNQQDLIFSDIAERRLSFDRFSDQDFEILNMPNNDFDL